MQYWGIGAQFSTSQLLNFSLTDGRIVDESVDAAARGEHEHAGAAVERVPRRHQIPPGLQHVLQRRRRLKEKRRVSFIQDFPRKYSFPNAYSDAVISFCSLPFQRYQKEEYWLDWL